MFRNKSLIGVPPPSEHLGLKMSLFAEKSRLFKAENRPFKTYLGLKLEDQKREISSLHYRYLHYQIRGWSPLCQDFQSDLQCSLCVTRSSPIFDILRKVIHSRISLHQPKRCSSPPKCYLCVLLWNNVSYMNARRYEIYDICYLI